MPDPADTQCPEEFKTTARKVLQQFKKVGPTDADLRQALLAFVSELSNWNLVGKTVYVSSARELVKAAYGGAPYVMDPFSGGGSIPLEGLRLGCEVTATELNPVAWLLLKIALEWCGRNGPELADLFETWSEWVLKEAENRLSAYYPADAQRQKPLAYLWARTVRCEASGCGATIPLIRNLSLSDAKGRKKALRISYPKGSLEPHVEVFAPATEDEIQRGTVAGNNATCPKCHIVTPRERVQAQLCEKRGGANDAILLAVARENLSGRGKDYHTPTQQDIDAFVKAEAKARNIQIEMPPAPPEGDTGFRPRPYGITTWADVLAPRQVFSRWVIHEVIEDAIKEAGKQVKDKDLLNALAACLYTAYSDNAQYHTSLCVWLSEGVKSVFIQGSGVPMRADFVEGNPLSPNCEGLGYSVRSVRNAIRHLASVRYKPSSPLLANALDAVVPEESMDVVFTDPPYANQIPYAHLSDFFYGWLRLGLRSRLPHAFTASETEKALELTENRAVKDGGVHDRQWYESHMRDAFGQMKRVIREDGIASVVFAHKDTDRWEALVSALVQAGWRTTGSWPIATERKQRMRGQGYAALETSVHLACRPRPDDAPVGDWAEVLRELPDRVGDWMERLQTEGVHGADLVFACIGPALEIFSRYSKVETADGREVKLAEYLEKVWEVVGRTALEHILGTAEAKARNGAAGALEEDARLTALFLWTLQSTNGESNKKYGVIAPPGTPDWEHATEEQRKKYAFIGKTHIAPDDWNPDEDESEEEDEEPKGKPQKGFSLLFDVARRFAQPLGIHLPEWEGRIIKTEKGVVHLLPISERAKILFGEEGAEAVADRLEHKFETSDQLSLFSKKSLGVYAWGWGEGGKSVAFWGWAKGDASKIEERKTKNIAEKSDELLKTKREATTLDRVHAAMILQASGRANALRALLKAEQDRGPDFLRLANALSALYPKGSEEKRLLDAMLLVVPR